jgi:ADP-heptose:LPS heptosyltransferase
MDKVAIIQPTHLGDLLCSVPLFRALRRGWPEAEIIFAGDEDWRPLFHRFAGYYDRLLLVDDWSPELAELLASKLAAESLDLVIPLSFCPPASFWDGPPAGGPEPAAVAVALDGDPGLRGATEDLLLRLARRMGARCAAGLADRGIGQARLFAIPMSYWRPVPVMLLELARALGVPSDDTGLEFPLTEADQAEATTILNGLRVAGPEPIIGLHPGSDHPRDRWPHERFAAVGDLMIERYGARIVVTGTDDEAPLAAAVVRAMRHGDQVVNLCGQTSLGCFAALVDRMDLLISNDTGAAHVARARGRPVVVICSQLLAATQWFNWGSQPHRTVLPPDGEGAGCSIDALLAVPMDAVAAAATDLLAGRCS